MAGFDLIIFDCDGVLVDSEIIAAQMEAKLLTEAGYPIEASELAERFAGMDWKTILLTVEKEAGLLLQASLLDKSEKMLDEKLAPVPFRSAPLKTAVHSLHCFLLAGQAMRNLCELKLREIRPCLAATIT